MPFGTHIQPQRSRRGDRINRLSAADYTDVIGGARRGGKVDFGDTCAKMNDTVNGAGASEMQPAMSTFGSGADLKPFDGNSSMVNMPESQPFDIDHRANT